jgi:hypothetical protein
VSSCCAAGRGRGAGCKGGGAEGRSFGWAWMAQHVLLFVGAVWGVSGVVWWHWWHWMGPTRTGPNRQLPQANMPQQQLGWHLGCTQPTTPAALAAAAAAAAASALCSTLVGGSSCYCVLLQVRQAGRVGFWTAAGNPVCMLLLVCSLSCMLCRRRYTSAVMPALCWPMLVRRVGVHRALGSLCHLA